MTEQQRITAALWWSDRLRKGAKQDNGDKTFTGAMVSAMATMKGNGAKDEEVDRFEVALLKILEEKDVDIISTDYHPCPILQEAANEAGIPASCGPFPMKTIMWIQGGKVEVKYGYGAKIERLL